MLCSLLFCFVLCDLLCWFDLLHSVPVCSGRHWSVPLCSQRQPQCFSSARETQSFPSVERELSEPRGASLYGRKSPPLVPNWSVLMPIRTLNPCCVIGPKVTALVGQNRTTLVGQSCAAPNGWGKPQPYWLKQDSRSSFIRPGSDGRNTVQAGSSAQASPWSAVCVRGSYIQMAAMQNGSVLFCFLIPASNQEPLVGFFFLKIHSVHFRSSDFSHEIHFSKHVLTYFVQGLACASLHGGSMYRLWSEAARVWILALSLPSSVTLNKFHDLSVCQFPHLSNGSNNRTYLIE